METFSLCLLVSPNVLDKKNFKYFIRSIKDNCSIKDSNIHTYIFGPQTYRMRLQIATYIYEIKCETFTGWTVNWESHIDVGVKKTHGESIAEK